MPDPVGEEMAALAKPLRRLYDAEVEKGASLKRQVAANRDNLTRIAKALRAVDPSFEPDKPKPKTKRGGPGGNRNWVPSPEKMEILEEAVVTMGAETASDIKALTGLSSSVVNQGLKVLREREVIRLAGKTQGQRGSSARRYLPVNGAKETANA